MSPQVDLVLIFRSSPGRVLSKPQARENARQATQQYARLLEILKKGCLQVVGKRGEQEGQLLVLVHCPEVTLERLVQRERYSDFLCGLPTTDPTGTKDLTSEPFSPADRLRLVYTYVTATPADGGLGVAPGSSSWDRVESVMVLHDHDFNEAWIRAWTTRQLGFVKFDKIREQFGEAVALYFHFLSFYTKQLMFISAVGVLFFFFARPYSTLYSSILLLWSITFVEWWRIKQRQLSVGWGTKGSFRVEKRRAQHVPLSWWRKDLRALASLPVILFFASVLAVLLTGIFVFEAFVTQLYTGPGHELVGFSPTILFTALVPRLLSIYHAYAVSFTNWENHAHQSTHDASLTVKTFSLSAIVAYLGIALSAFVYVPFGEEVMSLVQYYIFHGDSTAQTWLGSFISAFSSNLTASYNNTTPSKGVNTSTAGRTFWERDSLNARTKLNPKRLQDQMFAFTVTNQVVNTFLEIGLPFVLRAVSSIRNGRGLSLAAPAAGAASGNGSSGKKKRVMFEDQPADTEAERIAIEGEEREFMDTVKREVALPAYDLFADYSEMVTQFGYVSLWSTIWPLAPVMALINNWLELRSDAFKITVHVRRPIPTRTDTIGPWLDTLTFLTWLSALTNSALVYLFRPGNMNQCKPVGTLLSQSHHYLSKPDSSTQQLLGSALLIALGASHGYILLRMLVRHTLERVLWRGSREEREAERAETVVKEQYLRSLGVAQVVNAEDKTAESNEHSRTGELSAFWSHDEGLDELSRGTKEA